MKTRLLILLIGLSAGMTSIFSAVKVTGVIISSEKEAVPFANIALTQHDHLITGTTSNETGYFELTIDTKDDYVLSISHILYAPQKVEIKVQDNDINLGTIEVSTNSQTLDDVNVVASDVVHKTDRDVIVLNEKYTRQTTSMEQVLQKLPSVSMDIMSGDFKVENRENVLLQVDGIVKSEQYIRALPPANIIKVEIIKDVSGRFANEYDAIINIITNKSLNGYSLSGREFSIFNMDDLDNSLIINASKLNYSYFTPKMTVYTGYARYYNMFMLPSNNNYEYDNSFKVNHTAKFNDNTKKMTEHNFFVGTDFKLGTENTLSAEFRYSLNPNSNNKKESKQSVSTYHADVLLNQYELSKTSNNKIKNPYAQLSFVGKIGDKNKVNAGACYYLTQNQYSGIVSVDNNTRIEEGEDKKDYVDLYIEDNLELNSKLNMDFNYDFRYQNTNSNYQINNIWSPENSNSLTKHNAGLYFNYHINDNSKIKIGSAIENIHQKNTSASNEKSDNKFVVLPFLSYNNKLSKKINLKLNYKVNTETPTLSQLSSFTAFVDSFTTSTGNPLLTPSYYHEVKGTFDFDNGKIVLQPFYHFGNNVKAKTGILTDNHIISYTYDNAMNYEKYGFDMMTTRFKNLNNKDQIFFTFEIQKYWENAQVGESNHSISDWNINSQLAYLSQKHDAMLAIILQKSNTKKITALGYRNNSNDYLVLYLKKAFFNSKMEFGCSYITPYKGFFTTTQDDVEFGNGFNRDEITDLSLVQNTFVLNLTFNLNKNADKQIKTTSKKEMDNDKTKGGIL